MMFDRRLHKGRGATSKTQRQKDSGFGACMLSHGATRFLRCRIMKASEFEVSVVSGLQA